MICKKCGKEIKDDLTICNFCGSNIDENQTPLEPILKDEEVLPLEMEVIITDESIVNESTEEIKINTKTEETLSTTQTFEGVVVSETQKQQFTEEQEIKVEKLKQRKDKKIIREVILRGLKIFLNVLWIIFGGISTCAIVGSIAVIECITIIGIPFGYVLFMSMPLLFMPIGKRVVLHYGDQPLANTLWLIFGGFLIALIYSLCTIFVAVTIIGLPIAIQMSKICIFLWAPFGAEIIGENEFSSVDTEVRAYTVQYLRKERIVVDFSKLNCTEEEQKEIEKICNVNKKVADVLYNQNTAIVILFILSVAIIVIPLIIFVVPKITFLHILLSPVFNVIGPYWIIFKDSIYSFITPLIDFIQTNNLIPIVIIVLIILMLLIIIPFLIIVVPLIIIRFIKPQVDAIDYGFATKKELIKLHDSGWIIKSKTSDLIYLLYKIYEEDILKEISKDR